LEHVGIVRTFVAFAIWLLIAACGPAQDTATDVEDRRVVNPSPGTTTNPTPSAHPTVGQASPSSKRATAPDFTLRTLDGDTFTLSDHFGELPVVLNFWAPW
jgi:hypothetical protein